MAVGLISENDAQSAVIRLRKVLPPDFCRHFFGSETLRRLELIVGQKEIGLEFLLNLLVRQEGPQLLAARPRRMGRSVTSVRRRLLEAMDELDLRQLYEKVLATEFSTRRAAEEDLAEFKWHRGSANTLRIARALGLPDAYAGNRDRPTRGKSYEIEPIGSLLPLKPYQRGILREIRSRLTGGRRVMVSSFTGTGKTRLGMEHVVDVLLGEDQAPVVVWVAQKSELLDQACEAIEQVWPWRGQERGEPLQVYRYWGGVTFDPELPQRPTLVVASSQQMIARIEAGDPFASVVLSRAHLVVLDEAHHALAAGHQRLIEAYEYARGARETRTLGLTATPGRSNLVDADQSRQLAALFGNVLIVPNVAERGGALNWFQRQGYLARISQKTLDIDSQVAQTLGKLKRHEALEEQAGYRDYTPEFLGVVGEDSTRNRGILREITRLHNEDRLMLVFCCNIAQANLLSQALVVQGTPAAVIHHQIDHRDRQHTIAQFRKGELRILFNVEVLTTGFDAPKVDTIVMCRPTLSRVLYEQMVGRGMRGPQMGGTEACEIVDFTTNFGRFQEPQAWEAFWQEWNNPKSENLERTFAGFGWDVVGAVPEAYSPEPMA